MKRDTVLSLARVAGYHDDSQTFVRLYVENRISRTAMNAAWEKGIKARKACVPCDCMRCKAA